MLELAYLNLAIAHSPGTMVQNKMILEVERTLAALNKYKDDPKQYHNGKGYWDDLCLARLLEGVCKRYMAYPVRSLIPLARTVHTQSIFRIRTQS